MKGVIVQVGEPKSIILFNSGKIGAIPTPADCHVGMVVTVKYNNKFKITVIALAAVLLVGLGVFIGVSVAGAGAGGINAGDDGVPPWQRGQAQPAGIPGGGAPDQIITVKQAKTLPDDAFVILQGTIEQALGKNGKKRYILNDGTDTISMDIDKKLWVNGLPPGSNDVFVIYGKIDREDKRIELDVQRVVKK